MIPRQPPRLALAILERILPDSSPLAGDLSEEFQLGRSRSWFWWQALAAIAFASFRRTDEIRPLRLVDLQPTDAQERSRKLILRFVPVNLTASPLHGIGGLGIVALAVLVSVLVPAIWWIHLASILAGVLLGLAFIARGRSKAA